jgi:aspartate aminotransferase-like enzyme
MFDNRPDTLLMAPGPIRIPDDIRLAMAASVPYFTTKAFSSILRHLQPLLQYAFDTKNIVMTGTGSGSLGLESCVTNFFNAGETVIVVDTGKYGQNWVKMCKLWNLNVIVYRPTVRTRGVDTIQEFDEFVTTALKLTDSPLAGVFVTHTETTTAIKNDIGSIRVVLEINYPEALLVVDAVSSLLTEHLRSESYDVVVSASQKGMSCPPGLFFMTASDKALNKAENVRTPNFYFDVINEWERTSKNITTFTPASNIVFAVAVALARIRDIGRREVIQMCADRATYTRDRLRPYFDIYSQSPCNAVSAFKTENSNALIDRLYAKDNIVIGGGVRELNDKIFRIMHFGWDTTNGEVVKVIEALLPD